LDEIFIFGNLVMPEHQWVEKNEKIAERFIFGYPYISKWTQT